MTIRPPPFALHAMFRNGKGGPGNGEYLIPTLFVLGLWTGAALVIWKVPRGIGNGHQEIRADRTAERVRPGGSSHSIKAPPQHGGASLEGRRG